MSEITTIKLSKKTKARLENLRVYKYETYDELILKMLEVLNLFKTDPAQARQRISILDAARREYLNRLKE